MDRSASPSDLSTADIAWPTPETQGPLIVHKRRRLLETPQAGDQPTQPGPDAAPRGPRVFTLKAPAHADAAEAVAAASQETPATPGPVRLRRVRDAAHKPGEVTRIVFTPEADDAPAPVPAPSAALPGEANAFAQVHSQLDELLGDVKRSAYFAHLKFF